MRSCVVGAAQPANQCRIDVPGIAVGDMLEGKRLLLGYAVECVAIGAWKPQDGANDFTGARLSETSTSC